MICFQSLDEAKNLHQYTIEFALLLNKPDLLEKSKWGSVFDKNIEAEVQDQE